MIIPPSTDGVRQYAIPQWIVPCAAGALLILVVATVVSTGLAMKFFARNEALAEQAGQNAVLQSQLARLNASFEDVQSQLAQLEDSERRVRMVFGFPEIDPAERALGIGGFPVPFSGESISEVDYQTFDTEARLDRLVRRCEFERENFDAIYDALTKRKADLNRTPSIAPVTSGYVSRGFGKKPDPFTGRVRPHHGIDIAAHKGTPVRAPADGRVISRKHQSQLGRVITIDHGNGVRTVYGHLSKFAVKAPSNVKRGDIIGYVGNTGYSTGPHLHYEVRVNGRAKNPMNYIYDFTPWDSLPLTSAEVARSAS